MIYGSEYVPAILCFTIDRPLSKKYGGHEDQLSSSYWGMDRFRIQALDKLLNTSRLEDAQRSAVCVVLSKKCKILIKGAVKHQNKKMQIYGETVMKAHGFYVREESSLNKI